MYLQLQLQFVCSDRLLSHALLYLQHVLAVRLNCLLSCHLQQQTQCTYSLSLRICPGGCFWGVELAFQRVPGVTKTSVGYTAGHDTAPSYNSVCSGRTGHTEAVQVLHH